jgi:transglutaminase-like putative cysteine protease
MGAAKVRIELEIELSYEVEAPGADFIFNIHPASTPCQAVSAERLSTNQAVSPMVEVDARTGNRYLRLRALPGELRVSYRGTIDLQHHRADPADIREVPVHQLPLDVLGYIYPSRYCESDKLMRIAMNQFAALPPGYRRVESIMAWVRRQVTYTSNTSNSSTSAVETVVEQVGVCRDFAHLMIALCRALNIPARFTTGTDYGADPALGPPDFHAYVEAFIGDRWYIFDPSSTGIPMGFVRIGTGRDAADVSVATIFGSVKPLARPAVRALAVGGPGFTQPLHTRSALSTDGLGR